MRVATEVVAPTAVVGAGYLIAGGHWEAFKAALATWGIPPGSTALMAPVVLVLAVLGVRSVIRLARPGDASDAEAGDQ